MTIYINSPQRNSKGKEISKKAIHLWSHKTLVASSAKENQDRDDHMQDIEQIFFGSSQCPSSLTLSLSTL
jgi:hypothetical protein